MLINNFFNSYIELYIDIDLLFNISLEITNIYNINKDNINYVCDKTKKMYHLLINSTGLDIILGNYIFKKNIDSNFFSFLNNLTYIEDKLFYYCIVNPKKMTIIIKNIFLIGSPKKLGIFVKKNLISVFNEVGVNIKLLPENTQIKNYTLFGFV